MKSKPDIWLDIPDAMFPELNTWLAALPTRDLDELGFIVTSLRRGRAVWVQYDKLGIAPPEIRISKRPLKL